MNYPTVMRLLLQETGPDTAARLRADPNLALPQIREAMKHTRPPLGQYSDTRVCVSMRSSYWISRSNAASHAARPRLPRVS